MNTPTNFKYIRYETIDNIAVLQLSRNDKHNAINQEFMYELLDVVDFVNKSSVKALILTTRGTDVFASGGDIKYFMSLKTYDDASDMSSYMHKIMLNFENLDIPTVCAINGSAIGGGAEITLPCDIRFLRSDSFIQFKEKEIGVTTGWGGTYRLVNLVGYSKALELLLSAKKIDAKEAKNIGLVNEIYDKDILFDKALEFCKNFSSEDIMLIKYIKKLAKESKHLKSREAMELERRLFSQSWMLGKREKEMKKFITKRK